MKKKFWITILTAVLLLNLLPGMMPSAAADDTQSLGTLHQTCPNKSCKKSVDLKIIGYVWKLDGFQPNEKQHWLHVLCPVCGEKGYLAGDDHTGGTETPTCTTGMTCEKCGGEYGILGHDWSEWTSNDNNTHTRTCQREGCGETETGNCNSSTAHCGETGKCDVCGGDYYHAGHYYGPPWKYGYDENNHWHACYYCENGKDAVSDHWFGPGNMYLASPATCVSKAVYYKNCLTCNYKGTETYEPEDWSSYGKLDPNNHTGNEEIRGAVEATCTQDGYTGDTHCKDCDALLSTGTVIPATGHTGGTATCKDLAVCEVCHKPYGETDAANHAGGTEVRGAKDATCTAAGYTGDTYCKGCGVKLASGKAIPATGHTGGTATCKDLAECEVCHKPYGEKDASNHAGGTEVRGAKDADCTQNGYTGDTYCKDCDALLTSGKTVPATGHTGGTATCYWKATCEVCGETYGGLATRNHIAGCEPEWIVTETEHEQKYSRCGRIAALKGEHTFGDWTVTQEAAPGEAGEQERVCTVCGYAETEEIAALAAEESPGSAPVSAPEPEKSAEPITEPSPETPASGVVWWIVLVGVIAGMIVGIIVRRKKKK